MGYDLLVAGARIIVYINGKKFGRATSFSWVSTTPHRKIEGIDSTVPYELAPTRQNVNATLGILKTTADGGIEGVGMVPRGEMLPRGNYFTLALVDKASGLPVFRADWCVVDSQQWQVAAKGRLEGVAQIQAVTWSNEITAPEKKFTSST